MKLTDYKKAKIYRDALRRIVQQLNGIEIEDQTRAERSILAIAEVALESAR